MQIVFLVLGIWGVYRGFMITYSKKYFLEKVLRVYDIDSDTAYEKIPISTRKYLRYRGGLGGLGVGIILLGLFCVMTFIDCHGFCK